MNWRGATTTKERILACLPYLVPLLEVFGFGSFLFALIPPLMLLFLPLLPLLRIYHYSLNGIALIPILVFFFLLVKVVHNPTLKHFLRFNAMQALLLAVFAWLCSAFLQFYGYSSDFLFSALSRGTDLASILVRNGGLILGAIIVSAIFIVVVGASIYSVVQCLRGKYAEMPLISEAAYSQVR